MPLRLLKRAMFPEEFVIDEPRESVFRPESLLDDMPISIGEEEAGQTRPEHPWEREGEDLVSQVGKLLYEQLRLEQRTKMLESGERLDDEFARFVRAALPFLDNFWRLLELAREHPPSDELKNWLSNVESLYFRLVRLLENHGLVFINSVGKEVNLDLHEVVEYRPTTEYPHNYVIKELERGVVFRNRLLRDAKVVVAYHP